MDDIFETRFCVELAHEAYCLTETAAVCSLLCYWLASYLPNPVCYLTELHPQPDEGYAKLSLWKSLAVHWVIMGCAGVCIPSLMMNRWTRFHFNYKSEQRIGSAFCMSSSEEMSCKVRFVMFVYFSPFSSVHVNEITGKLVLLCVRGSSPSCRLFIIHTVALHVVLFASSSGLAVWSQ